MTLSRSIAETILKHSLSVKDVVETLETYHLVSLLPNILSHIQQIENKEHARDTLLIESPFPLGEKALARIKRLAENDLAEHEVIINKDLLAGFKARYRGKLYDGSAERIIKEITN
jgi:F0F1-type ATP synthase delta subunit